VSVSPHSKSQILILSERLAVTHALGGALTNAGYEVNAIAGNFVISDIAQKFNPDLILLDFKLSRWNGITICQQLKANPLTQTTPVILLTGADPDLNKATIFEAGGVDYIAEPFVWQEVFARINHQLTIRDLQKKLREQQVHHSLKAGGMAPLLAILQKQLHQQAEMLKEKNGKLQQEIRERQQTQESLKAEQEKSERLLLNVLPRTIADRLKQERGVLAERFDEVTILFADIVDFTPLSARLTPLALVELLNQIFSTFDQLAEQFGLEKIKTIGDAYMVAGGVPVPRLDHAQAVMEMAIAMRKAVKQFVQDNGKPLQLRIGINTGTVVAGVIGISKFSYDLWGDAVNIASRMESQGLPGKIQVTEATYQRLQHQYIFERWGVLNIKGKGTMTTYLLVGRK
jgi:adenylate cyclase